MRGSSYTIHLREVAGVIGARRPETKKKKKKKRKKIHVTRDELLIEKERKKKNCKKRRSRCLRHSWNGQQFSWRDARDDALENADGNLHQNASCYRCHFPLVFDWLIRFNLSGRSKLVM